MERLVDMPGRYLLLTCDPCARHGRYRLERLRKAHGQHADVLDVAKALTQTCRWQQALGNHRPAYNGGCQVTIDTDEPWRGGTGRSRS